MKPKKYILSIIMFLCHYMAMAFTDDAQQIVYGANYFQNTISAYTINPSSGLLTPLDIGLVTTAVSPADISVLNGKFMYVVGWDDSIIHTYTIQKDGKLVPGAASVRVGIGPWGMYTHPVNKHMYISNFDSASISMLDVDQTNGNIELLKPSSSPAGTGVCGLAFNPADPKYLYGVNYYQNNITLYEVDSVNGTLQKRKTFAAEGQYPRSIRIINSHAYVANQHSATVSMFDVDKTTGELTPRQPATIKSGIGIIGSKIEKSGQYYYVASYNENMIYMYKIQEDGLLTPLSPAKVSSGVGPRGFAEDKFGHLYVSNMLDNSISMYQVESDTGVLIPLSPNKISTGSALALAIVDVDASNP